PVNGPGPADLRQHPVKRIGHPAILRDDPPGPPRNLGRRPISFPARHRYTSKTRAEGGTMSDNAFVTCLWFDTEAETAASFYTGIFKDSGLGRIHRYTEAGPGEPGAVMLVEFELNGQKFSALNGGPQFTFNEAVSIVVPCADQAEVDYYWS